MRRPSRQSILIDISHPAHVHFFRPVATALLDDGFFVRIVARDKDATVRLLEASGLDFSIPPIMRSVGSRGDAARELRQRVIALRSTIKSDRAALVLTRNPSGVLAAAATRTVSIFDTDDGRTVGPHYWLARPFASIITTSVHDTESHGRGHHRYNGLKAQMFLHPDRFQIDSAILDEYNLTTDPLIAIRFSSHDASHDAKTSGIAPWARAAILERASAVGNVLISIEGEGLSLRLRDAEHGSRWISVAPEHFHRLLGHASLFIGDSQSVAAEAAVLGVPSLRLSSFSGATFYLTFLEELGLMRNFHAGEDQSLLRELDSALSDLPSRRRVARDAASRLNDHSEDLLAWFHRLIIDIVRSGSTRGHRRPPHPPIIAGPLRRTLRRQLRTE